MIQAMAVVFWALMFVLGLGLLLLVVLVVVCLYSMRKRSPLLINGPKHYQWCKADWSGKFPDRVFDDPWRCGQCRRAYRDMQRDSHPLQHFFWFHGAVEKGAEDSDWWIKRNPQ
jgi:hypothetical protein